MGRVEYIWFVICSLLLRNTFLPLDECPLYSFHETVGDSHHGTRSHTPGACKPNQTCQTHTCTRAHTCTHAHAPTPQGPFWQRLPKCYCGKNETGLWRAVETRERQSMAPEPLGAHLHHHASRG